MGPHDRAKLQAKLDLAKAKVLRRTPKDPGNFRKDAEPRFARLLKSHSYSQGGSMSVP